MHLKIDLNEPKTRQKVTSDSFGLLVSHEWKRLLDPYTPRRDGLLMENVQLSPWQIKYVEPYSAYMYYGEIYVDPIFAVGGFTNDGGITWFSRPGVEKIPSGRHFNYSKALNPFATDQWDIKAAEAGQLNKLYRTLNSALQSGKF